MTRAKTRAISKAVEVWNADAPTAGAALQDGVAEFCRDRLEVATTSMSDAATAGELLARSASKQIERISTEHSARARGHFERLQRILLENAGVEQNGAAWNAWRSYVADASRRAVLTLDALRERGDIFLRH